MSVFITACEQIFAHPLYLLRHNEQLSVAIATKDYSAMKAVLTVIASSGQIPQTKLSIALCCPAAFSERLQRECPLIRPTDVGGTLSLGGLAELQFIEELFPADCIFADPEINIPAEWNSRIERIRDEFPEPVSELMRLALNVNYVYQAANLKPRSFASIREKLLSKEELDSFHSSLLQALHIPVKLFASGADEEMDPENAAALYESRIKEHPDLVGVLTALEHRRWMAYQICNGWNCPTEDEVRSYAFEPDGSNGFKYDQKAQGRRMHPALVPCREDGVSGLIGKNPSWWANCSQDELNELDDLDRTSVQLHRIALEKAIVFELRLNELLTKLERNGASLDNLRAAIQRLIAGQHHAYGAFQEALNQAKRWVSPDEEADIRRLCAPRIEVNSFRDYKKSDSAAADQLGFILIFRKVHTCIAREMSSNLEENAIALVMTDPEWLLLCIPHDMSPQKANAVISGLELLIKQRSLRTQLLTRVCENFRPESYKIALEAMCGESGVPFSAVTFDLTGARAGFTEASAGFRAIIADGGMQLMNFRGCPAVENFNRVSRSLSVDNVLAISNRFANNYWRVGNWGQIEAVLPVAFRAYLNATDPSDAEKNKAGNIGTVQHDIRFSEFISFLEKNVQYNAISGKKKYISINKQSPDGDIKKASGTISIEKANSMNLTGIFKRLRLECLISDESYEASDDHITYTWSSAQNVNSELQKLFALKKPDTLSIQTTATGATIRQLASTFRGDSANATAREMLAAFVDAGLIVHMGNGDYRFLNSGVRSLLLMQGNLLEDLIYQQVKSSGAFSSYALSCEFSSPDNDDIHELDVVAVTASGNRSVFFSCKSGRDLDQKMISEISNLSNTYGFNRPIAVFVASCSTPRLEELKMAENGSVRRAAERMNVYFIDRDILRDPVRLNSFLCEIADA